MSEEELEQLTDVKLQRLRNLRMFRGKTDDEIREFIRNRKPKEVVVSLPAELPELSEDEQYAKSFKTKLRALQNEYGVDMNNSNDAELLRSLVRHIIQQENVNNLIVKLQNDEELDTRTLKNLGDFQRTLMTSITDMQEKLGIARKLRKEKQIDDVAVFIADLKKRGKEFFDKKTIKVMCNKCHIELVRYWLNFPALTQTAHFEVECWKCHEVVIYTT